MDIRLTRFDTNMAVKPQKMAKSSFSISEEEGLHYLCGKNKTQID